MLIISHIIESVFAVNFRVSLDAVSPSGSHMQTWSILMCREQAASNRYPLNQLTLITLQNKMRILLVEDDLMIGKSVCTVLKMAHFTVNWVRDGIEAEHALGCENYSLLLLDLGLPRKHGLEILKSLRQRGNTIPVLILTARDTVEDRILGLNCGADDYLVKPFDLDELIARMRALLRRNLGQESTELVYGEIAIDTLKHEVKLRGVLINLSAKEFIIFQALMERPGAVLSRDKLEEKLYGWDDEIASNTIQVHIHNLRKRFGVNIIQNVRGVGYRIGLF